MFIEHAKRFIEIWLRITTKALVRLTVTDVRVVDAIRNSYKCDCASLFFWEIIKTPNFLNEQLMRTSESLQLFFIRIILIRLNIATVDIKFFNKPALSSSSTHEWRSSNSLRISLCLTRFHMILDEIRDIITNNALKPFLCRCAVANQNC